MLAPAGGKIGIQERVISRVAVAMLVDGKMQLSTADSRRRGIIGVVDEGNTELFRSLHDSDGELSMELW